MCSVSCLLFSIQNIQIADSILLFYSTQFFLFWPREKTRFNPFRPKAQFEIFLETRKNILNGTVTPERHQNENKNLTRNHH